MTSRAPLTNMVFLSFFSRNGIKPETSPRIGGGLTPNMTSRALLTNVVCLFFVPESTSLGHPLSEEEGGSDSSHE
jgi:hypothetical protein